jgi:hypothetical protein
MFGGVDNNDNKVNDTWEWDGTDWTQVADTGPSPEATILWHLILKGRRP